MGMFAIQTLSRYHFEGKSEQAIREEWIRPLLVHLGYGIETLNEIRYEESLKLAKPFRRIGRQRVEVDYCPTVLGHGLWIIEAKAHDKDDWDEAVYQAFLYATHPEIDVPFMMIADGARIAVYDAYRLEWDEPIVDIATPELASRLNELAAVVGAADITRKIRERRMHHLGAAMKAELSASRLGEYISDVQRLVQEAQGAVAENERAILRDQFDKEQSQRQQLVQTAGLLAIGIWTNQPFALGWECAHMGITHLQSLPTDQRTAELRRLIEAATYRKPPNGDPHPRMFWMLRATALEIYLATRDDEGCGEQASSLARAAIRDHILNFPEDPLARAAHRLEKVLPAWVLRSFLTPEGIDLTQVARDMQQDWGDEARLRSGLDADRLLIQRTTELSHAFWTRLPWTAPVLDGLAAELERAIPTLEYRRDGATGPAGDPFLDFYLRADDLQIAALEQLGRHFSADLIDEEIAAALARMADTDYDFDGRFLRTPAQELLKRIDQQ